MYTCEHCSNTAATIYKTIHRLPRILVLHLKRFAIDVSQQTRKLGDSVEIGSQLEMTRFCSPKAIAPASVNDTMSCKKQSISNNEDEEHFCVELPDAKDNCKSISSLRRSMMNAQVTVHGAEIIYSLQCAVSHMGNDLRAGKSYLLIS